MGDSLIYRGNILISDRKKIEMDSIEYILSFDESYVSLGTKSGKIVVEGKGLKIDDLSNESGKIRILGEIDGVYFSDGKQKRGIKGLFS